MYMYMYDIDHYHYIAILDPLLCFASLHNNHNLDMYCDIDLLNLYISIYALLFSKCTLI